CQLMRGAIQNATYMVHSLGELNPEQRGMSTTASAFYVAGSIGIVGQVGDSRVYLSRDGRVSQLTEDHTLVNYQLKHGLISPEEAKRSRIRNVITRAVGHKDYVEVDTLPIPLFARDRILLCSDGLHGYLTDAALERLMAKDVQEAVLESIRFANEQGGSDNITRLLIELIEEAAGRSGKAVGKPWAIRTGSLVSGALLATGRRGRSGRGGFSPPAVRLGSNSPLAHPIAPPRAVNSRALSPNSAPIFP